MSSIVPDVFVLTASFNLHLTRPVTEGTLRATGRVVHRSRTLFLAEAELRDPEQRLVARGSGSFMRSTTALTPDVGYEQVVARPAGDLDQASAPRADRRR